MKIPLTLVLAATLGAASGFAQTAFFQALDRPGRSLNGDWRVIVDPYENGFYDYRYTPFDASEPIRGGYALDAEQTDKSQLIEYSFEDSPTLAVPGDWNSQSDRLYYYEGTVWYRQTFELDAAEAKTRSFLYFGAVNYEAHVYLNGKKLGVHVGGFTPFDYEVTGQLMEGRNTLVLKVDNKRHRSAVPTLNTDWWNYGGITRDVRLIQVPDTFIERWRCDTIEGGEIAELTATLNGPNAANQPIAFTLNLPNRPITVETRTDTNGHAHAQIALAGVEPWSPEDPELYKVTVASTSDRLADRIGFRTIATKGPDILLNGKSVFLRGICIHEENPLTGGRAWSETDARLLLGWAKELGCNFVRLAHYPHNEYMARLADEMGILVWEEIPVYWTIDWENPDTLANATNQLDALISRDINRASVIVWSMANETPVSEPRTRFLKTLVDEARARDGTRLISAAMEVRGDPDVKDGFIVDDPFGEYTDIISFNEYIGWYNGLPEKCERVSWKIDYDKPVIISEFGAGAKYGYRADALTRFSEEFQAELYRQTLPMLERIPNWRGATPWILVDFHSPRRPLPRIQDGYNRKGLLSERGEKKRAYKVLQDFYRKRAVEWP